VEWLEVDVNSIIEIAQKNKRDYITPEDVSEALKLSRFSSNKVRLEVLEVLGEITGFGVEDPGLCAFVAWKGKSK
jgi:predicted ATP-dependent protease